MVRWKLYAYSETLACREEEGSRKTDSGLVQCPPVARGEAVANHPVFEQCTMPQNPNQTKTDEKTTDDWRKRKEASLYIMTTLMPLTLETDSDGAL